MRGWSFFLLSLVLVSMVLSCTVSCLLCFEACQRRRNSRFEVWRMMMHRFIMRTRTTQRKAIYVVAVIADVLSIMTSFFCWPLYVEALGVCNWGFAWFLLIIGCYSMFAVGRLCILVAHFIYGQRFWRWVKRSRLCGCLNVVEYEQRVDFDIYDARDYVKKVNENVRLSLSASTDSSQSALLRRQSTLKVELKFDDLTCAICLEGFGGDDTE
mmetsp:Transcript_3502/g.4659  ORF Transcript_3502/g.4659 Transcript_3502/m.4659 type:complete len:212 (+) Transcript_3502:418-1053(+)